MSLILINLQGSNMYFYTGPGGATNDSPINSDDDEETVKVRKCQISEPASSSCKL